MENQVQARDKRQGHILEPPRTVLVDNWKGSGKRARINVGDYDPQRDGNIIPGAEHQHFGAEIAGWHDELHRRAHASDQHKRSTGVTGA